MKNVELNYDEIVPIDVIMDSQTEKMVSGKQLEAGDVILLADTTLRENVYSYKRREESGADAESLSWTRARLMETSRWCRIVRLENRNGILQLEVEYQDGHRAFRTYNERFRWYVSSSIKIEPAQFAVFISEAVDGSEMVTSIHTGFTSREEALEFANEKAADSRGKMFRVSQVVFR